MRSQRRPSPRPSPRRLLIGLLATLLMFSGGFVAVAVTGTADAAIRRCNPGDTDWPDCLPTHAQLDGALSTPRNGAYFWTGRTGGENGTSVEVPAGEIAHDRGGITLESAIEAHGFAMPDFPAPDAQLSQADRDRIVEIWTYASRSLALHASGIVFVVTSDWRRPNNIWDTQEQPRIINENPDTVAIFQINVLTMGESLIWHRPGYTEDQVWLARAQMQAERLCPLLEAAGFPRASTWSSPTSTGAFSTVDATPIQGAYTGQYWGVSSTSSSVTYTLYQEDRASRTTNMPPSYRENIAARPTITAHLSHGGPPEYFELGWGGYPGEAGYEGLLYEPEELNCKHYDGELKRAVAAPLAGKRIRLMPLGDSITFGVQSSDGNGYRDRLHDLLDRAGATVDFVGSEQGGSMSDNDNEGHPGWRIDQVAEVAACTVPQYQPNVVTLHIGTNDANQNYQISTAADRVTSVIEKILADSPHAVVLVSQVITTGKAGLQPRIDEINFAVNDAVRGLRQAGKHVMMVSQEDVWQSDGLQDDAHPTDAGYDKMAGNFDDTLTALKDWITDPDPVRSTSPDCDPGATALGPGWRKLGVIAPGTSDPGRVELADVDGDHRDDYIKVHREGSFRVLLNQRSDTPGQPHFVDVGTYKPYGISQVPVDPDAEVPSDGFRFADLNGDGRADLINVTPTGKSSAFLNLPGTDGALNFVKWGILFDEAEIKRGHIRFADIDGDGCADLLQVGDEGNVHAYFNVPNDDPFTLPTWRMKKNWAPGAQGGTLTSLRFGDVNGDGAADYLTVGSDGSVHAYFNNGGLDAGGFTPHLNFAYASDYPREYVQFHDISGDGKADYLVVYKGGAIRAWLNRGGNQ
ncbi:GDSL-type esterase/lipase family protein [Mangrovihabitans endophyticus]|uniref:SGNH hydrolase-type esterase domain-containing protein n=1 Tax=Mangrovihabitans endophyticus TaxID=1751298 RepID=A0A8J3FQP3_9ACTN|nr:GDSL-type esterase/lipase family protein [Mangrovihabitans endophyticus]GGL02512.1 hypothetical protein GCM10012284_41330 [Mangrovihabitans endophyticus]